MRTETAQRDVVMQQGVDDVLACLLLVGGRHGVLKIHEHDIGAERGSLLQHARITPGNGKLTSMETVLDGH
jgi:hypothetical protein